MERTLLLGVATWVGGVGAWGVGVGYVAARRFQSNYNAHMMADDDAPVPPVEALSTADLPSPPLPLDTPESASLGAPMRSASPAPDDDALEEMEEFLLRQEARRMAAGDLTSEDDGTDDDDIDEAQLTEARARAMEKRAREAAVTSSRDITPPVSDAYSIQTSGPPDASALLTESQRRRLAPIKPLKRERRSRKIRVAPVKEDKFVPLVREARGTTADAIVAAYTGEDTELKREQGEDFWVDPQLLQEEVAAKEKALERRKKFKTNEQAFGEQRLKEEIVAPYKGNVIGAITIGIGVIAAVFAAFPSLLELNEPGSIASFPAEL